jgi:hypothetical protein
MVKLKHIKMYNAKDVPDHLVQEVTALAVKMGIELQLLCKDIPPNLILSALNFTHAAMIKSLVSDDPEELKRAAETEAVTLLKNVEFLLQSEMSKKND